MQDIFLTAEVYIASTYVHCARNDIKASLSMINEIALLLW